MKKSNTFFLNDKLMTESYQISSSIYSFYKQLFLFESQIEKKYYIPPLAWKIPWMEEPGRLQSMGSRRVGND